MTSENASAGGLRPANRFKAPVVVASSTLLMVTWKYLGSPGFYYDHIASHLRLGVDPRTVAALYHQATCLLLFGLIPVLIVKRGFREDLSSYGVGRGDGRRTLRSLLVLLPFFLLIGYVSARDPAIAAVYPANRTACSSAAAFGLYACSQAVFYVAWEFHFRGYLQHGIRDQMGEPSAVLVQMLASTLIHLDGPASETYGAMVAGAFWGMLAFHTRSLLSGLLQHYLLGLAADYSICFVRF
jgi:membrane protease YdiL (CAAX protease family)